MTAHHRTSRLRTVVHGSIFFLLAVGLVETWLVQGLAIPCRVVGDSMAGALVGAHREIKCGDCGFSFSYSTDTKPNARIVCPQCGYGENEWTSLPDVEGQRVLIDRATYCVRQPRRWEIIAFRPTHQADQILTKRIAGLPGESLEIQNGDIYADGCIQRKNLAEQRALAVLVHDACFQPTKNPTPPRWRAVKDDSRWHFSNRHFAHAAGPDDEPADWLAYYHVGRLPNGKVRESPVTDLGGYSSSQLRREENVHIVSDLLLSLRLAQISGRGTFFVRMADGRDCFETRLQRNGERGSYRVYRNGLHISEAEGEFSAPGDEWLIEASLVDRQFLLAINGQTLVTQPFGRPKPPRSPLISPVAICAQGIAVNVEDLRLYRDVYYARPPGFRHCRGIGRPAQLGEGEFYVLGDNSPASEDSRQWPEAGTVDAKLLLGKPLAVFSDISLSLGGCRFFQVPNPAGIRYIQ